MTRRAWGRALAVAVAVTALLGFALVRCDLPREELTAKYASDASRFADIEGMRVHYRDEGHGPPLLLIHGTSSSLHTWDGWARRMATERRVVRLDLPGFGLTGPAPDGDYRVDRYARVVATLMDRLEVSRADVAGNSLGGRVALTLALGEPARVRKLVLVDAAGLSGHSPPAIFRLARVPVVRELFAVATPRWLVKRNVADVYGDPTRIDDALVDRYYELTLAAGNRRALLDRLNGPPDPDLDDQLATLRLPVLILWGSADRWIPISFAHRLANGIPGAGLRVYAGAGHVPMEELAEETARDVAAFLRDD